jgi:hypothetical protein
MWPLITTLCFPIEVIHPIEKQNACASDRSCQGSHTFPSRNESDHFNLTTSPSLNLRQIIIASFLSSRSGNALAPYFSLVRCVRLAPRTYHSPDHPHIEYQDSVVGNYQLPLSSQGRVKTTLSVYENPIVRAGMEIDVSL